MNIDKGVNGKQKYSKNGTLNSSIFGNKNPAVLGFKNTVY